MKDFFFGPMDNYPMKWFIRLTAIVLSMFAITYYQDFRIELGGVVHAPLALRAFLNTKAGFYVFLAIAFGLGTGYWTRFFGLVLFYLAGHAWYPMNFPQLKMYYFFLMLVGNPKQTGEFGSCAIRTMQLDVLIMFLSNALYKCGHTQWLTGEKMYYVLLDTFYSRFMWPELLKYAIIVKPMSYGCLFIQLFCPAIALFSKRFRYVAVAAHLMNQYLIAFFMYPVLWVALPTLPGILMLAQSQKQKKAIAQQIEYKEAA